MSPLGELESPVATARIAPAVHRFRWSVEDYQKLAGLDLFQGSRVELIDGEIFEMSPQNAAHANAIEKLIGSLMRIFAGGFRVRFQLPLVLGPASEPEPDAAIVAGTYENSSRHPQHAALVVEASDSSLHFDRTVKAGIYAQAGIPEYWICNIQDRQLEVHRRPEPDPKCPGKFHYAEVTIVPATGSISSLAMPEARIAVADLLP